MAFYARQRIPYWDMADPAATPWVTQAEIRHDGVLFVCRADNARCQETAASFTKAPPIPVAVSRTVWGVESPVRDYVLFMMPGIDF